MKKWPMALGILLTGLGGIMQVRTMIEDAPTIGVFCLWLAVMFVGLNIIAFSLRRWLNDRLSHAPAPTEIVMYSLFPIGITMIMLAAWIKLDNLGNSPTYTSLLCWLGIALFLLGSLFVVFRAISIRKSVTTTIH